MKRRVNRRETIWMIAGGVFALTTLLASAQNAQAQWTTGTNINNTNSGTVSVGTSSSVERLTVANGSPSALGVYRDLDVTSVGAADVYFNLGARNGSTFTIGAQLMGVLDNPATAGYLVFSTRDSGALYERMRISANGNVGIGTTSPDNLFDVSKSASGTVGAIAQITNPTSATGSAVELRLAPSSAHTIRYALITAVNATGNNDIALTFGSNFAERMRIDTSGNVGIGTTSPDNLFDVSKSASGTVGAIAQITNPTSATGSAVELRLAPSSAHTIRYALITAVNATGNNDIALTFGSNFAERMRIDTSGNVGIGTTSPAAQLHVTGSGNGTYAAQFINTYSGGAGYGAFIKGGNNSSDWALAVRNTGDADLLRIRGDGNVGIGTDNPGSYKLNVNGDTNVAGNLNIVANGASAGNIVAAGTIYAKYQDVAEWVPSAKQLARGTVVVLDSTKSNQVISSSQSYDTRVAGVISAQPGIALGEKSDSKVLVATTGRVKVKVDASKGPIHIGDLLVTSDIPGVAMKSEPVEFAGRKMHMPGTLIGKALEPLEKGSGEILVLLSLQ